MDMVNSDIGCTLGVRETQPRMGAGKITFHLALETARLRFSATAIRTLNAPVRFALKELF